MPLSDNERKLLVNFYHAHYQWGEYVRSVDEWGDRVGLGHQGAWTCSDFVNSYPRPTLIRTVLPGQQDLTWKGILFVEEQGWIDPALVSRHQEVRRKILSFLDSKNALGGSSGISSIQIQEEGGVSPNDFNQNVSLLEEGRLCQRSADGGYFITSEGREFLSKGK